jgi:hypothetical protein
VGGLADIKAARIKVSSAARRALATAAATAAAAAALLVPAALHRSAITMFSGQCSIGSSGSPYCAEQAAVLHGYA